MARHLLIADPDPQTARLLAPQLRRRGYKVAAVRTGSRALELCVMRPPDLVLFDTACPLLDLATFRQILRANPHTEQVPILVTGASEPTGEPAAPHDAFLRKPFNVDELLSRIGQTFRRLEAAQKARRGDQAMEGTLGQLPLTDLLQILGQNRKSGVLRVAGPLGIARLRLSAGVVAEAEAEGASGIKALFRLLLWREGGFAFAPGEPGPAGDIGRSVGELLLEGLRQADEIAGLRARLPDPTLPLRLTPRAELLDGEQRPLTAELLALVRGGATLAELLDRSPATDHALLQELGTLIEKGIVVPAAAPARRESRPLVPAATLHTLRARLQRLSPGRAAGSGKLLLGWTDAALLSACLRELGAVRELRGDPTFAPAVGIGTVGQLELAEGLVIDLLALPAAAELRPLWAPFGAGAIGCLLLLPEPIGPAHAELATLAARRIGAVVIVPGRSELPGDFPPEAAAVTGGAVEALREILIRASRLGGRPFAAPPAPRAG